MDEVLERRRQNDLRKEQLGEKYIDKDYIADGIDLPKTVKAKPYHTRNIDTVKTLNMDQILFNVLMGLRRQEINAVKYSDVDYINRTLAVERQLGKELDRTPNSKKEKSMSGIKAAGVLFFRMMATFAVPATAASRDQKIFTGGITKNF